MKLSDSTGATSIRPGRPSVANGPLSVSQLTALVSDAITSALPASISVAGEISNFKHHSSGHLYLTLKDSHSELSCVMWRSAAEKLKFTPADGLEVVATGHVAVFERSGRYQLYIRRIEPRGVGALELAFRQLCEKLNREGLFDAQRKQSLPAFPMRIALVTSPTGAAVADMLRTLSRRFPCADVMLFPVAVQGKGAAAEIAHAVTQLNRHRRSLGGVDVMIVGRGGGSLEDLWAFNEEVVARAIFASAIPVISAVGHEVDVTIADLVADVRAATPTAAAELAVPVLEDVLAALDAHRARLGRALDNRISLSASGLAGVLQRAVFRDPLALAERRSQLVDEVSNRLQRTVARRWQERRRRLDELERVVQRIAPHGYVLAQAARTHRLERRLHRSVSQRHRQLERAATLVTTRFARVSPAGRIRELTARIEHLTQSMPDGLRHRVAVLAERARGQEDRLVAMGYKSVLGRGFSITRLKRGRKVVRSVRGLNDRDRLVTELADGTFESEVHNLHQLELFD